MGVLHPDMKTAMKEGKAFAVFEFDDPGGTTHRYAGSWVASDSLGQYKGMIPQGGFGPSPRSVPLRGDRLEPISGHVTIIDNDGAINALVTSQYARQLRGMSARIKIVASGLPAEAFYTRFSGQVVNYNKVGHGKYKFDLGPKLKELEGYIKVPIITTAIWENAHEDSKGNPTPVVYGVHNSASLGSRGMLPTQYVDTVNYRYLVSHQYIEEITNVYVDHIVQGSGWTTLRTTRDGHRYTLVEFTSDQGDAVITVDAKGGVFSGAYSSYDEITNPATQLMYILSNYVFNEWDGRPKNWHDEDSDDAPIDWDLFSIVEQFFNSRGVKGSIAISEPITGLALLNKWAEEYCPVFWTSNSDIGTRIDDWYSTYTNWNVSKPRFRESKHFLGELSYDHSTEILADTWEAGFLYSESDNEALERIRVIDTLRGWDIKEEIELEWAESTV